MQWQWQCVNTYACIPVVREEDDPTIHPQTTKMAHHHPCTIDGMFIPHHEDIHQNNDIKR